MAGVFGLSLSLVAGGWLWAWLYLRKIEQTLILHFNSLSGINLVGGVRELAGFGILALVVVAVNFVLALALEERDWFLGKLLAAATLAFAALIFIGFAAIISVN